jgi:glycosyltransferase involved in cell wall biosynthesis
MNQNIAFFSFGELPYMTGNGNSVLMYGVIKCLQDLNFNVFLVPVGVKKCGTEEIQYQLDFLESESIKIHLFDEFNPTKPEKKGKLHLIKQIIMSSKKELFNDNEINRKIVNSFIEKHNIKTVIGYNWGSMSLFAHLENVLKIVSLVDLIDDFHHQQKQIIKEYTLLKRLRSTIISLRDRNTCKYAYDYLGKMDYIIEHAFQHCNDLKEKGFNNISYLPHPLMPPKITYLKKNDVLEDHITILIPGSLKGVSSQLGFKFFFESLLPELKSLQPELKKKLQFRIVGHGKPNSKIVNWINKEANVELIGYVEDIEEEYRKADILLVNIPISHGFRTRIAEAFSYGMCVVAHAANAEGMPEIQDGVNALIDFDPKKLAKKLINAANDPGYRYKLGKNAIETFETQISQKSAVNKIQKIFLGLQKSTEETSTVIS